jgi:hypothetical protein
LHPGRAFLVSGEGTVTIYRGNRLGVDDPLILGGRIDAAAPLGVIAGNDLRDPDPTTPVVIDGNRMPYSDLALITAGDAPVGGPYIIGGERILPGGET